ncbi:MAG: MotA/TolQ/ExbB proton channel family protein [Desulfobulbaceae bacterium]|uniref:MotA/TolQ/ExbB proton channel family protein n=1 Tax=Candidatus Desulfobia pelagia TaxID=2841692 RepID=A0A8J6TBU0_9BACT|nr:MotA/TolQ/ExbB proton channel family protein [Candidatus Desulfobia pelagia]
MQNKNVIGVILCLLLFLVGFVFHGNISMYYNISGFLVVIGGTFGATLLTYRMDRIMIVYKVLVASYKIKKIKDPEDIVEILVDLSVKSKFKGLLSLQEDEEETSVLFLRRALGLLVDGYKGDAIRDILSTEMYFFRRRREDCERVLRTMAELFPSFGLVGSVVGLIGMLAGIGSTATILATIPIALTSTLYGIILANFLCIPFAGNIREQTDQELLLQKIIMEGVIAIEKEVDPRSLERKLKSFLTPSSRNVKLVSLKRIQERFNIVPQNKEKKSGKPS